MQQRIEIGRVSVYRNWSKESRRTFNALSIGIASPRGPLPEIPFDKCQKYWNHSRQVVGVVSGSHRCFWQERDSNSGPPGLMSIGLPLSELPPTHPRGTMQH